MTPRLLDCRPARRNRDTTSASPHPELLVGEFAMRPRIHVALTPNDQLVVSAWSRRISGAVLTILVILVAWQMVSRHIDTGIAANASERPSDPSCITWDARASEAIVSFVQGNKEDINLKHISDMIAQMRKARRNCHLGWLNLACEDYRTIVHGALEPNSDMSLECRSTIAGDLEARFDMTTSR
jgi:hypothetical protein